MGVLRSLEMEFGLAKFDARKRHRGGHQVGVVQGRVRDIRTARESEPFAMEVIFKAILLLNAAIAFI